MTINFRAVYLGAAVDLGSSSFFGSILTLGWSYALLVRGIPLEQLYPTIIASPAFLLASSIVGFAFSFLGGYVAASTAKENYLAYGAASAIPCVFTGIFEAISPFGSFLPGWLLWGGKLGSIFFAFLGGRHAQRTTA